MNRRFVLAGLPATLAAAALPVAAEARSPVERAFNEWATFRAQIEPLSSGNDDLFDAFCAQRVSMERALADIPSASLRDAVLKVLAWTDMGADVSDDSRGTIPRLLQEMRDAAGVQDLIAA